MLSTEESSGIMRVRSWRFVSVVVLMEDEKFSVEKRNTFEPTLSGTT